MQYNGIPVGQVVDIRVDPNNLEQIQVTVEINTSIVDIKSDARAFLEANILNGIATIQIRGGTQVASDLEPEPGHKYPVIKAGRSELEEVKASLPELLADLKETAHSLNVLLDENNRRAVSDTLQNLRTITGAFVEPAKAVSDVVDNANKAVLELKSFFRECRSQLHRKRWPERPALPDARRRRPVGQEPHRHQPPTSAGDRRKPAGNSKLHSEYDDPGQRSRQRYATVHRWTDAVCVRDRAESEPIAARRAARRVSAAMTAPARVSRRLAPSVMALALAGCASLSRRRPADATLPGYPGPYLSSGFAPPAGAASRRRAARAGGARHRAYRAEPV